MCWGHVITDLTRATFGPHLGSDVELEQVALILGLGLCPSTYNLAT